MLSAEVMEEIAKRTDGVQLFVEELTKSILKMGELTEAGVTTRMEARPA